MLMAYPRTGNSVSALILHYKVIKFVLDSASI